MTQAPDFRALIRLSLLDPVAAGHILLRVAPPMAVRWMLLAATVSGSVTLLYLLPLTMGDMALLPAPFAFALTTGAMNLLVIVLITAVGRGFGGTGQFGGALWLVGWMQMITAGFLVAQIAAMLLVPGLNLPIAVASIAVSIWILVGYICALHGFASRVMVLVGSVMVFVIASFVLSVVLLLFGFGLTESPNV